MPPGPGLGLPHHGARVGVEGPVVAALLAGADELARPCRRILDREERRCLAEVVVRPSRLTGSCGASKMQATVHASCGSARVAHLTAPVAQVERHDRSRRGRQPGGMPRWPTGSSGCPRRTAGRRRGRRSCCRSRCRASRAWCRPPASCPRRRCPGSPRASCRSSTGSPRWRRSSAAMLPRKVQHGRPNAARASSCERRPDVDDAVEDRRRLRDDRGRVTLHLGLPQQGSRWPCRPRRPRRRRRSGPWLPRTSAVSVKAGVTRAMSPGTPVRSAIFFCHTTGTRGPVHRVEVAGPVGDVDPLAVDGGRRRDVATRRDLPLLREARDRASARSCSRSRHTACSAGPRRPSSIRCPPARPSPPPRRSAASPRLLLPPPSVPYAIYWSSRLLADDPRAGRSDPEWTSLEPNPTAPLRSVEFAYLTGLPALSAYVRTRRAVGTHWSSSDEAAQPTRRWRHQPTTLFLCRTSTTSAIAVSQMPVHTSPGQ